MIVTKELLDTLVMPMNFQMKTTKLYTNRKSHFQPQNSSDNAPNPKCSECQKPINKELYYSKSNQVICKECYNIERKRAKMARIQTGNPELSVVV